MLCLISLGTVASPGIHASKPAQDKTRQDKTGQDKAEQNLPQPASFDAAFAEGKKQRDEDHWSQAADAYLAAARIAHASGEIAREARALQSASANQIRIFQYRAALQSAEAAYALAQSAKMPAVAGGVACNLATIYIETGDLPQARREAQEAVQILEPSSRRDLFAQALLILASVDLRSGSDVEGQKSIERAMVVAQAAKLPSFEAMAAEMSGLSVVLQSAPATSASLDRAEQALEKAASIYGRLNDPDLSFTKEYLAELALKRENYPEALRLINEAFATHSASFDSSPRFYPIDIRGRILLGLGRRGEALAEFRKAVDYADAFWQATLPGDITSTQTVASLHDVYQDYVSLAASEALRTHDTVLSRQALEALASNRAASLRQQLTLSFAQNFRLPPKYFDLVSTVQQLQARATLGQNTKQERSELQRTRLELSSLENQIGLSLQKISRKSESNSNRTTLRDIQKRMNDSEALLSFSLGAKQSFLWAITKDRVNLYNLAAKPEIENQAKAFSKAIQAGRNGQSAGRQFSETLFSKLGENVWHKRNWLIVGDGALLDSVPFSAMPDERSSASANALLIDQHSLRLLPSELLIVSPKAARSANGFVGVADPVYNAADSRLIRPVNFVRTTPSGGAAISLARLVGSDREVRAAAADSGIAQANILSGSKATSMQLTAALANQPEIIHFAVHVVSPEGRPQEAALALSLTRDNLPELLTSEVIASYRVPGSLVVLSGCASEQGETLPSAGLIGLSRAWLLAGASAVIVSAWPTPDDTGRFFSLFYKHLNPTNTKNVNNALSIAERASVALEETQLEMQRGSDYRSGPSFWAAYSLISKE